jgi:ribosome-associated protein
MEQTSQLVDTITKGIQDKKGSNIVIADLTNISGAIADYFVICQGNSPSQVEAITESVGEKVRESLGEKPLNVVGLENDFWVAMDYCDVLVHVFSPDARSFYGLENLWEDAKITKIPDCD